MISISSQELNTWLITFFWPMARVLALVSIAPVLSNVSIPARVKVGLAFFLVLILVPTLPPMPAVAPFSFAGFMILIQQILIGLALGFVMRLVFAAVEFAGELIGLQMGLNFATFFDPDSSGQTPVLGKFLELMMTLVFLSLNGHALVIATLADSFVTLPISDELFPATGYQSVVAWGAIIFASGLMLALPIVLALLLTNLALGILTRAAPQLNLFAVGFPVTLLIGLGFLLIALPYFAPAFDRLITQGIQEMHQIAAGASAR